jgi:hypothetical protein
MKQHTWLASLIGLTLLQGCAGRAIVLREDAGALAEVSRQTVAQVRTFYAEQGARRLNYYLDALAQDPNCQANATLFVVRNDTGPAPFRCFTDELRDKCQAEDPPVSFECLEANQMTIELLPATAVYQSALTFIDVIADFQTLLARIATDESFDTGGELASLRSRLDSLQIELRTVFPGLGILPAVPEAGAADPFGDQLQAVGALLDIVRDAAEAHDALKALKAALATNGPAFEVALGNLASRYQLVDLSGKRLIEREPLEAKRRVYNDLIAQGKTAAMSAPQRREHLEEILEAERVRRERLASPDPIVAALHSLHVSEGRLREAVLNDKLSPEQRHRIAQENIKGLKAAFRAIAGVAIAFR